MGNGLFLSSGAAESQALLSFSRKRASSLGGESNCSSQSVSTTDSSGSQVAMISSWSLSSSSSARDVPQAKEALHTEKALHGEVLAEGQAMLNLPVELARIQENAWDRSNMLWSYLEDVLGAKEISVGKQDEQGSREIRRNAFGVLWQGERTVKCRVPVPAAPFCPSSSLMTVNFTTSVVNHATRGLSILIESTTVMHDVPYGSSFRICEAVLLMAGKEFNMSGATEMRMVKTAHIDFIQHTRLQRIIETNSLNGQRKTAQGFLTLLQRRAELTSQNSTTITSDDQSGSNRAEKRKQTFNASLRLVHTALGRPSSSATLRRRETSSETQSNAGSIVTEADSASRFEQAPEGVDRERTVSSWRFQFGTWVLVLLLVLTVLALSCAHGFSSCRTRLHEATLALHAAVDRAKAGLCPIGLAALVLYPVVLLGWMFTEGALAASPAASHAGASWEADKLRSSLSKDAA
mmetsp:Transcript_23617/g.55012  ORF Transcript_23617/g.55012 Transcript_23617/m.55012 type:complete len:464 (+) Transcript_23617:93-1484(+)